MKRVCYVIFLVLGLAAVSYAQQPERKRPQPAPFHEEAGSKGTAAPVASLRQLREFIRCISPEA